MNSNTKTLQGNSHIKANHNRLVQALHKQHLGSKF